MRQVGGTQTYETRIQTVLKSVSEEKMHSKAEVACCDRQPDTRMALAPVGW